MLKGIFSLYYGCPWDNTISMFVHFQPQTWLNTHVQAWEGSAMGLALPP